MSSNQIPNYAKVLIIGGGPAGSLTASFLVQEGIDVVLQGITDDNVQSVFDIINPILTGNFDMNQEQPLAEQKTNKIVSYMKSSFIENFYREKGQPIPEHGVKSPFETLSEKDLTFDSSTAINGYSIRFEKGNLGLNKGGV